MATKPRKHLLPDDLDLDTARAVPGAGRPQAAFHEQAPAPAASKTAVPEKGDLKRRAVATTLYLLPEDHRRLRRMAIDRDISFQTLMLDAIDGLLERENEVPVERWETRRKSR